jgi:hypothetical protein
VQVCREWRAAADLPSAPDTGGIAFRPDNDKIVVHHGIALHAKSFGNKFLLLRLGMHEHHIRVAATSDVQRLTRAQHVGLLLE